MLFNAKEETATLSDFSPLPAGIYHMCVEEMELKIDQNGLEYIALNFIVCDGEHKQRKIFENLYLSHQIETLQRNSRAKLKLLCEAKGVEALKGSSDFAQFIGFEVWVKLGLYEGKTQDGTKKARNIINGIKPFESDDVPEPPAPKAPSKSPW